MNRNFPLKDNSFSVSSTYGAIHALHLNQKLTNTHKARLIFANKTQFIHTNKTQSQQYNKTDFLTVTRNTQTGKTDQRHDGT